MCNRLMEEALEIKHQKQTNGFGYWYSAVCRKKM
jgi:hypothetical protein